MVEQLEQRLMGGTLDTQWDDVLGSWEGSTPVERAAVRSWVQGLRTETLDLARDVGDEEEVKLSVAVRYIELKCHWMMLNTRIQYELFLRGEASESAMYKGSLVSGLIGALESLLDEEDLQRIAQFLAEPIQSEFP